MGVFSIQDYLPMDSFRQMRNNLFLAIGCIFLLLVLLYVLRKIMRIMKGFWLKRYKFDGTNTNTWYVPKEKREERREEDVEEVHNYVIGQRASGE